MAAAEKYVSPEERLAGCERAMAESALAALELANLAVLQGQAISFLRRKHERQRWWNRALLLGLALVLARLLTACGGAPFESSSRDGSPLAGAQSSAGAQSAGASAGLSGGAGGVAGGNVAGNSAGTAGSAPDVLGGAGGADESGGAPAVAVPCDVSGWKASAFASSPTSTPALAVDGDKSTRWTSGEERAAGQWFALELGAGVVLEQLQLDAGDAAGDLPSSLELELDGKRVAATVAAEAGLLRLSFKPTAASSARLVLAGNALPWWSIAEIGGLCK